MMDEQVATEERFVVLQRVLVYIAGVASAGLLLVAIQVSVDSEPRWADRDPLAVTPATNPGQGNRGPGGGKTTGDGDGFGAVYSAATYRLSTSGCATGEVRFVKASSAGSSPAFFPEQTDCISPISGPVYPQGWQHSWATTVETPQAFDYRLYINRELSYLGPLEDETIWFYCEVFLPSRGVPLSKLSCGFYYRRFLSSDQMPSFQEVISLAIAENAVSWPVKVYQSPAPTS